MILNQKLAGAMQRILIKNEDRFVLTKVLEELLELGIGTRRGKSVYFTTKDKGEIQSWLEAKGFSTDQRVKQGMTRSQRLKITPNEKAGGERVKKQRISIKSLGGQRLILGTQSLLLPPGSHLDIDWTKIDGGIGHNCVLLVENYENFDRIHEIRFHLPDRFQSPLVIYRGDTNESRFHNVLSFLNAIHLPVLAFTDADPAGLAIATCLPRLEGIIFPPQRILIKQLNDPKIGRSDLFHNQYPVYSQALDDLPKGHPCQNAWKAIKQAGKGVVQERWIGETVKPFC